MLNKKCNSIVIIALFFLFSFSSRCEVSKRLDLTPISKFNTFYSYNLSQNFDALSNLPSLTNKKNPIYLKKTNKLNLGIKKEGKTEIDLNLFLNLDGTSNASASFTGIGGSVAFDNNFKYLQNFKRKIPV